MRKISLGVVISFFTVAFFGWLIAMQVQSAIIIKKGQVIKATLIKPQEVVWRNPTCKYRYAGNEFTSNVSMRYWEVCNIGDTAHFYHYEKYPDKFVNVGTEVKSIITNIMIITLLMSCIVAFSLKNFS